MARSVAPAVTGARRDAGATVARDTSAMSRSAALQPAPSVNLRASRSRRDPGDPRPDIVGRPARAHAPGPVLAGPRYFLTRLVTTILLRCYVRLHVEGRENLPAGPCVICFSHLSWADPFAIIAALPWTVRLAFFGPREEDMHRGMRNRLMRWSGAAIPYKPGKRDLVSATRKVDAAFARGAWLAIAGEGRIHAGEDAVLPLSSGAAYFALRESVPIVPVAVNGTSWLAFGRRVRVRIGPPIVAAGAASRANVDALSRQTHEALQGLVRDHPNLRRPGPFGRWLTEVFNDWPEGQRPEADDAAASGAGRDA